MFRNQAGKRWRAKAISFVGASMLGGAVAGALLGAVGAFLAPFERVAAASVLGLVALCVGAAELSGEMPLLQCNRETPQVWMHHGPIAWALRNGMALGCGATTRLGFALWYIVPLAALLSGDIIVGGAIYLAYGLARAAGAILLLGLMRWRPATQDTSDVAVRILALRPLAQRVSGAALILFGVSVAVGYGF